MMSATLGKLAARNVRDAWQGEASDFTPWLAQPEQLETLGEILGMELELEGTEHRIGEFRADIVCREPDSGRYVLIENQLEPTNHGHLGQLLTYAAGLGDAVLVWVSSQFRADHQAALQWLNEVTSDKAQFFGIEIQVWSIDGGPMAPRLEVVVQPNEWVRQAQREAQRGELTERDQLHIDFWTGLAQTMRQRGSPLQPRAPWKYTHYGFPLGKTWGHLELKTITSKGKIRVLVWLRHPAVKAIFAELYGRREQIEEVFRGGLIWHEGAGDKVRWIGVELDAQIQDRASWPSQFSRLTETLERLEVAFRPEIEAIDPDQLGQDQET